MHQAQLLHRLPGEAIDLRRHGLQTHSRDRKAVAVLPYAWWHQAGRTTRIGRGRACRWRASRRWRSSRRRCCWRHPAGSSAIAGAKWICRCTSMYTAHAQKALHRQTEGCALWCGVAQPAFAAARSPCFQLLVQPMGLRLIHCTTIDTAKEWCLRLAACAAVSEEGNGKRLSISLRSGP